MQKAMAAGWGVLSLVLCLHPVAAAASPAAITTVEIETNGAVAQPIDPLLWRGKTTVLYVWGDWCRACARSTPEILRLAEGHADVRFVFINTDDPARPLAVNAPGNVIDSRVARTYFGAEVMRKKGFRFSELGLVFAIPAYFVIDPNGNLLASGNGSRYPALIADLLKPSLVSAAQR